MTFRLSSDSSWAPALTASRRSARLPEPLIVERHLRSGALLSERLANIALPTPLRRVLIIDDNSQVRFAMYELLDGEGYDVAIASDGVQGVKLATRFHPDIVLLDLAMPRLDGYSVARALRSTMPEALIIAAVTSHGQHRDVELAQQAGFDYYFQKPFDVDALFKLLADGILA